MSRLDNIFQRIIQDPQFAETIGSDAARVRGIDDGKRAINKNIRSVAEILDQVNKKVEASKMEQRLQSKAGNVVIPDADYNAIYRKIVSLLTK